jgi:hypothetical protein
VYGNLEPFAKWFTHQLLKMHLGRLASAVEFLVFEAPKVMMLLTLVVFGVGIVRSFFTPERTRHILVGKCESAKVRKCESAGSVFAALLGVVTPFCSCSAVPLLIGFVTTGVPLGVTFSFLISAPMVNEVAHTQRGWRARCRLTTSGQCLLAQFQTTLQPEHRGRCGLADLAPVWSLAQHEETHLMTSLSARALIGERGGKIARFGKWAFSRDLFTSLLADLWATNGILRFVCFAQCNGNVHPVSSHSLTLSAKPISSVTSLAGTFAQVLDSSHSGWRVFRPDASDAASGFETY